LNFLGNDRRRLAGRLGSLFPGGRGGREQVGAVAEHAQVDQSLGGLVDQAGDVVGKNLDGEPVAVLNGAAANEEKADLGALRSEAERLEADGNAWSVVLRSGRPVGLLAFSDEVVPGVSHAVGALRNLGVDVAMVTGDNPAAANRVARDAGISEVHARMLPEDKLALIRSFQNAGRKVAFVGDGVNDAPALAAADLGIAIGAGTEVAREAGGVILIRSDFSGVASALRVGRRTVRKVRGNLTWAVGYNAVLLPVAMGVLVPVFGLGVYSVLPITGALAMARLGLEPLARPVNLDGTSTYCGYIFVRKDSGIKGLKGMRGKRMAFVDRATTAGYIFPVAWLKEHGVDNPARFFSEYYFTGSHDAAIDAVLNREADVGCAKHSIYNRVKAENPRVEKELVVLEISPNVPENGLLVRKTMDPALKHKLKEALLGMGSDKKGREALRGFGALTFIDTTAADYNPVFRLSAKAGIDIRTYHCENR
jgi:soluble P-type ATPase